MNIKNKILAALLIFVFVASISVVVAEDVADAEPLAADNAVDSIAVSEEDNAPVAAAEDEETQSAQDADVATADGGSSNLTSLAVKVDVLDKNPKAGDEVRFKITVSNLGDYPANNVMVGFAITDLQGNPDSSFELVDDGGYAVEPYDGGYVADFGFLGAGDTQSIVVTFLATEPGTKLFAAIVTSDDSIQEPDSEFAGNITIGETSANNANKAKAASAETLPATGNPLALLALSLFCIVPYYRRK